MTWKTIDQLEPSEAAEMSRLILYAAVDGMDGADLELFQDKESYLQSYWHGSIETAARTMAFLFAGSNFIEDDGIGIGDATDAIMHNLEKAAVFLMRSMASASNTFTIRQSSLNQAERFVNEAAISFFNTFSPTDIAKIMADELYQQQRNRESERERYQG
jgi:hypothetical protein